MPLTASRSRIAFLDWLRGLAAVIMLQGHAFHSFLRPEERDGAPFIFSQFFGGQAAAIFLFLTGVTYALGMNRREYLAPVQRVLAALRRAGYLFLLAILFRIQTFAFSWPKGAWSDLLRVDILNTMGVVAALLAILALFDGLARVRLAALAGVAMAVVSPIIANLNSASVPASLRNYFVQGADNFSIFPWGTYLAFGLAAGSAIPLLDRRADWSRVMQWSALAGFGLLLGGQYFSNLPYSVYTKSDFWLNSPTLVACKLGITLLLASAGFLWTEYFSTGWSWFQQLGTTSLLVYWVHIELTYGRLLDSWKNHLTVVQAVAVSLTMIALMVALSVAVKRTPWRRWKEIATARLRPAPLPVIKEEVEQEPVGRF